MEIKILHSENARCVIQDFLLKNDPALSFQLELATRRFCEVSCANSIFLVVCYTNNQKSTLMCGYQIDNDAKTINIPFVFASTDISAFIKGKSIILAKDAFVEITQKFKDYSFFALATPSVNKFINKMLCPPMQHVGIMRNYFVYSTKANDAFLYWKPSNIQDNQLKPKQEI